MKSKKSIVMNFEIVDCCGRFLKIVTMKIPNDIDPWQFEQKAIIKAGLHNYICGSCYDSAYHVKNIYPKES